MRKIGWLCVLRKDNKPDDHIAKKLDFGSTEAMHKQLLSWGLPEWLVYKDSPKPGEGAWLPEQRLRKKSGSAETLPPADAAAPLFGEVLESLAQGVENLSRRHEVLHGGQFVVAIDEEDPDGDYQAPGGVSWVPAPPLPILIAVYALSGRSLEPLLEKLHPGPAAVDREQIRKLVEGTKKRGGGRTEGNDGLKRIADKIAALVCGGKRSSGKPPPELFPLDQNMAYRITELREAGVSDEEIRQEVGRFGYTKEDVFRLGNLGLRRPKR